MSKGCAFCGADVEPKEPHDLLQCAFYLKGLVIGLNNRITELEQAQHHLLGLIEEHGAEHIRTHAKELMKIRFASMPSLPPKKE